MLERILGENWTAETAKAWIDLWELSSSAMMKVYTLRTLCTH